MATASDPATEPTTQKRLHKATYASDNRKPGNYLIRIVGPTADKFREGREVPVTRKDNTESLEKLGKCIWSGPDEETPGMVVALYRFEAKPRKEDTQEDLPF